MIVDLTHLGQKNWDLMATIYVDYEIPGVFNTSGKFIPWFTLCYDNVECAVHNERENAVKVDLGVKLDSVITNTVFGITWNSGNLLGNNHDTLLGFVKTFVEIKY